MNKIGIILCTTVSETKKIQEATNIKYLKLKTVFSDCEFVRGEISLTDYFQRLTDMNEVPKTSQPAPGEIIEVYEEMLDIYENVIVLTPSINLSGTYQNCVMSTDMLDKDLRSRIHVIDTQGVAMTETIACEYILSRIDKYEIKELISRTKKLSDRFLTFGAPGTLKFLKMSGRVNMTQAAIGSLINLKVMAQVENNMVTLGHKGRGFKSVLKKIDHEIVKNHVKKAYYTSMQEDDKIKKAVLEIFDKNNVELIITEEADIVSATHFGPNSFGFTLIKQ